MYFVNEINRYLILSHLKRKMHEKVINAYEVPGRGWPAFRGFNLIYVTISNRSPQEAQNIKGRHNIHRSTNYLEETN